MIAPEFRIVGLGEVLWDLLPAGRQLGGAPANFVYHAHALGAQATMISRVGNDADGKEIVANFRSRGLPVETIQVDAQAPTGTVSVEVGAGGHPQYVIHENVAWDRIEANDVALNAVRNADAVCFGTLAQRTASNQASIGQLLTATRPDALRIFDINLRPPFVDAAVIAQSLAVANVLKLNELELPVLAGQFQLSGEPPKQLATLADRFSLRLVALTRGGEGSLLLADGQCFEQPAVPVTVRDSVGAGDSFTAAVVIGLLRDWPLERIARHASAVAAFVCSQSGATPRLPEALRELFLAIPSHAPSPV